LVSLPLFCRLCGVVWQAIDRQKEIQGSPESVAAFKWNGWQHPSEIAGKFGLEYAQGVGGILKVKVA
jgi:hypothetical protein